VREGGAVLFVSEKNLGHVSDSISLAADACLAGRLRFAQEQDEDEGVGAFGSRVWNRSPLSSRSRHPRLSSPSPRSPTPAHSLARSLSPQIRGAHMRARAAPPRIYRVSSPGPMQRGHFLTLASWARSRRAGAMVGLTVRPRRPSPRVRPASAVASTDLDAHLRSLLSYYKALPLSSFTPFAAALNALNLSRLRSSLPVLRAYGRFAGRWLRCRLIYSSDQPPCISRASRSQ
jgi:hypothetical protein